MSGKPISLACLNSFLVPVLFNRSFSLIHAPGIESQKERAERIASLIKSKDISLLQEMYGSQASILQNEISSTHQYPDRLNASNFPLIGNVLNTFKFWMARSGGLWYSFDKSFTKLFDKSYQFSGTKPESPKGIQAFLLDLNSRWPESFLLIFNVYIETQDEGGKWQQIQEIFKFVNDVLLDLKSFSGSEYLNSTPLDKFSFEKCGILLCGDFNVLSNSQLYDSMHLLFGIRDLYKEFITRNKTTEVLTFDSEKNPLATSLESENGRIDYIFALDSFLLEGQEHNFLKLEVEDFQISIQESGMELSSHWPLEALIVPSEKKEEVKPNQGDELYLVEKQKIIERKSGSISDFQDAIEGNEEISNQVEEVIGTPPSRSQINPFNQEEC
eukprot:TRINITY_DN6663_c0_g1_i1.p1 TRINITY_DN6663_c0_g1~~TRINITY_DN6663_c0_g1_i1.p1  ORF type:complete len:386 (+),score=107.42 TRINITY_DN6663_c0_g1_i1:130-1287(+)